MKWLTYGFGPKIAIFPTVFLGNISQENVFCDILQKKNAFKTRKRKFSESLTNGSFLKGLVHGFGQKIELFLCIFFGQIKQEKILVLYSDEKRKLLIPEKLSFKKV